MKDLKPGMVLKGTVRNVIDFGCFVDIGVHQDGLVHISHITDKFIKHPLEAVSVGDIVDVQVLDVELDKKRISLTMKLQDPAKVAAEAAAKAAQRPAPKATPAPEKKAAPKRTSVVDQVAAAAGVTKKPAAKKAAAPKASAPAGAAEATPKAATTAEGEKKVVRKVVKKPASTDGAATTEAPKKFKKKGIVIFKGNANE